MPLRPPQEAVFPPDLFQSADVGLATWWVLHTKPRTEKALAERLLATGISYFLPQYAKIASQGVRRRTSYLPLFPGYLFLRGPADDRTVALKTNYVAGCLDVPDQRILHRQLSQVHQMMVHDPAGCRPEADPRVGALVEVTEGPFAGMTGRVIEINGGYQFVVEVEFIGRGVAITLGHWMFRRIAD